MPLATAIRMRTSIRTVALVYTCGVGLLPRLHARNFAALVFGVPEFARRVIAGLALGTHTVASGLLAVVLSKRLDFPALGALFHPTIVKTLCDTDPWNRTKRSLPPFLH